VTVREGQEQTFSWSERYHNCNSDGVVIDEVYALAFRPGSDHEGGTRANLELVEGHRYRPKLPLLSGRDIRPLRFAQRGRCFEKTVSKLSSFSHRLVQCVCFML